jgi:hypothetical protein
MNQEGLLSFLFSWFKSWDKFLEELLDFYKYT